jgi:hypothetical protein
MDPRGVLSLYMLCCHVPQLVFPCGHGVGMRQVLDRAVETAALLMVAVLRVSWTGEAASVWEERLAKGGPGLVLNVLKKHLPDVRRPIDRPVCDD